MSEARRLVKEDMMQQNEIQQSIVDSKKAPRVFTTRNGVNLRIRAVSPFLVMDAQKKVLKPQVPTYQREGTSRVEENPNDPSYVQALEEYNTKLAEAVNDAFLANGITVIPPIPEDILPLDDDSWVEGIEYTLGTKVPDNGMARKVMWLKYIVIPHAEDLGDLIVAITTAGGLAKEADVQAAIESFRSDETRSTDNSDTVTSESEPRNIPSIESYRSGE